MAKILDLSVIEPENFIIKIPNGDEFTIPGTISLSIVLHIQKQYQEILESQKGDEELYHFMKKTIMEILRIDKDNAKKVTDKYITTNHIDSIAYMNLIIDGFISHVASIEQDENLSSPQPEK